MAPKKKRNLASVPRDSDLSTELGTSKSLPEPSSGCTKIVSISDKELLSVFSRTSLCDLQSLELVSHRFRWIALKVYSDRRSLSLIQTPQYRDQLEDITRYWYFTDYTTRVPFGEDCFRVTRNINSTGVEWLAQRFPKVTQLTLYCVDLSVAKFVQLIQLYPTLERLTLFCTGGQQTEYNQPQFWNALYSLRESLRHLHLPFDFEHQLTMTQLSPLFTPTLQSLYLKTALNHREMFGENVNFDLEQNGAMRRSLRRILQILLFVQLYQLTRIGLYLTERNSLTIAHEATNFMLRNTMPIGKYYTDTLTHLDLAIPANIGLLSILPALSKFTRLTHIRLTERKSRQQQASVFFPNLNKQNYRTKLGQPNQSQLPSVRQLNLSCFDISPTTGIFLNLSQIFPQIHTLCLEDCPMATNSTGKRQHNSFPIWLLKSFRRFDQLHQIYHNQRLVLQMDRDKDGDKAEKDKLVRVIVEEMLEKGRI